jgi:hypothetical protein
VTEDILERGLECPTVTFVSPVLLLYLPTKVPCGTLCQITYINKDILWKSSFLESSYNLFSNDENLLTEIADTTVGGVTEAI